MNAKTSTSLQVTDSIIFKMASRWQPQVWSRKSVLIVEGQPEVRELLSLTLETSPYTVLVAENAQQALALARTHQPDLIVMDVVLPGSMDGLQVCRQLKRDILTRDGYIMILSARGQFSDKEKGYEAGADDYMVKPFSPMLLQRRVREILNTPRRALRDRPVF